MPERLAALVLNGNSRAALVAVRSLGRAGRQVGVLATLSDSPSVGAASRYARFRGVLPDLIADEGEYVKTLLDVLDAHPAEVVLAVGDDTIDTLRRWRPEFASRTRLALASEPALATAVDKEATLELARSLGLATPHGLAVSREDQVDAAGRMVGFPCVVKPATSWAPRSALVGRLQCLVAMDAADLRAAVRSVLAAGTSALVQQWVAGRREAVHLLYAYGKVWARVCVVTVRTASVVGGNSAFRMTVRLPEDTAVAAERLVAQLGLEGYAEVEFRRDAYGRPVLMEVNPRLSASVEAATRAGVDFPVLVHDWARGAPLRRVEGYRTGVRLRWLGGELRWLRDSRRAHGHPDVPSTPAAMATLLAATVRPAAYDYVDLRDPWPAVRAVANLYRKSRTSSRIASVPRTWPDRSLTRREDRFHHER
jgi:predicted ATP-grasp superfamily ATP-dependent carboligase